MGTRRDNWRRWEQSSLIYLCGGTLALNLFLILGLLALLAYHGLSGFWPRPLLCLELKNKTAFLGEVRERETARIATHTDTPQTVHRIRLKAGNRDLADADFKWIDEADIVTSSFPKDAVLLERAEWGNFHGRMVELRRGPETLATGSDAVWRQFLELHPGKVRQRKAIRSFETRVIGGINYSLDKLRLARRRIEMSGRPGEEVRQALADLEESVRERSQEHAQLMKRLEEMCRDLEMEVLRVETVDGKQKVIPLAHIVRALRPNDMGLLARAGVYLSRLWEFVWDEPRESNTEGGIFPTIFGTILMVFLMSFAVTPIGVLAAVYLREYAKEGHLVRIVRISVNNLAGVPSIVFGMFGLGFFVYIVGGTVDRLFYPEALPTPTFGTGGILWASLTLAMLTVPVVIVATEEGLAAVPREVREGSLALGATKSETLLRVVLPAAAPGILTGLILAMARAAGEVAPLMIVGMVKLAPALPIDHHAPFVHLERKFMHLGFHIYDVGFQSPNVEATRPLVFATAVLLILVVTTVNLTAILTRNYLRRKYATSVV